jgi:hypothetical protein
MIRRAHGGRFYEKAAFLGYGGCKVARKPINGNEILLDSSPIPYHRMAQASQAAGKPGLRFRETAACGFH